MMPPASVLTFAIRVAARLTIVLLMGVQTRLRAPMGGAAVVAVSTLCLPAVVATPPLLPPGPRLRDLAASRSPPLLFGTDLVDSCPMPLTGNPRGCGPSAAAANASYTAIAGSEFGLGNMDWSNSWTVTQPTAADTFDFSMSDRLIPFMRSVNMSNRVNGIMNAHNLLPGTTCPPRWLTDGYRNGTWSKQQLQDFLKRRIDVVVPHWIHAGVPLLGIFAVNEAIANQPFANRGGWPNNWITGPEENLFAWAFNNTTDWFGQAFRWVSAAARRAGASSPSLRLFYNDYGIETANPKSDAVLRWLTEQRSAGVPIDGIGFQAHMQCDCRAQPGCNSTAAVASNMKRFVDAGMHVWVTEMDVQMLPGCTAEMQAAVFRAVLEACIANAPHCDSFMVMPNSTVATRSVSHDCPFLSDAQIFADVARSRYGGFPTGTRGCHRSPPTCLTLTITRSRHTTPCEMFWHGEAWVPMAR